MKRRRIAPKLRRDKTFVERTHNSTDWYYFRHFDKEFKLADQDNIPTWDIVEDKKFYDYTWTSMYPVRELDPHPEDRYEMNAVDKEMNYIDVSDLEFPDPLHDLKMPDITVPHELPLEHIQQYFASKYINLDLSLLSRSNVLVPNQSSSV